MPRSAREVAHGGRVPARRLSSGGCGGRHGELDGRFGRDVQTDRYSRRARRLSVGDDAADTGRRRGVFGVALAGLFVFLSFRPYPWGRASSCCAVCAVAWTWFVIPISADLRHERRSRARTRVWTFHGGGKMAITVQVIDRRFGGLICASLNPRIRDTVDLSPSPVSRLEGGLEAGNSSRSSDPRLLSICSQVPPGEMSMSYSPQRLLWSSRIGPGVAVLLVPGVDGCRRAGRLGVQPARLDRADNGRRCRRRNRCRSFTPATVLETMLSPEDSLWMLAFRPCCCCSQFATSARVRPPAGRSRAATGPAARQSAKAAEVVRDLELHGDSLAGRPSTWVSYPDEAQPLAIRRPRGGSGAEKYL